MCYRLYRSSGVQVTRNNKVIGIAEDQKGMRYGVKSGVAFFEL